jgi:hypothetical protein
MKKYIGYGILVILVTPVAIFAGIIAWPIPFMMWLMGWLFDDDPKMDGAGPVCGIILSIVWIMFLLVLPYIGGAA